MHIPLAEESWDQFVSRVTAAILHPDTHIYVDTSFLMWLVKVGRTSRKELFDWLTMHCPGRVHVPAWAAHEFLGHHVAKTISKELDTKIKEMHTLASSTYGFLRPFLDDQLAGGTIKQQQVSARTALLALSETADVAKRWKTHYEEHAREVITFVSEHVPPNSSLFDDISGIQALGIDRYDGRVPPGFQDRRKNERTDDDQDALIGNNRWGDLLFWKEVLSHAEGAGAKAVVILSRDCKNDWHFGGRAAPEDARLRGLSSTWKPLPVPHPTLALEAKLRAKVDSVVLLDSMYLAALLREQPGAEVSSLVDVAIIPDLPGASTQRKELATREADRRSLQRSTEAAEKGLLFLDPASVDVTSLAFKRALINCRAEPFPAGAAELQFLTQLDDALKAGDGVTAVLSEERFTGLDNAAITRLGRAIHDRALRNNAGYDTACADLLGRLHLLPPGTAGSLMLGVMVSMFLIEDRVARVPPSSPVASKVYDLQDSPSCQLAVEVLARRLDGLDRRPLYACNATKPNITIVIDIQTENDGLALLNSVTIDGIEVFDPAQLLPEHNLRSMLKADRVSGEMVMRAACDHFGLPVSQVVQASAFANQFDLSETAGFKKPQDVYREKLQGGRDA